VFWCFPLLGRQIPADRYKKAIAPLIKSLPDDDPSFRVIVIRSLERLHATEAISALTLLVNDRDSSHWMI
jgi:hypothetical protein